jgi:hypothetical protein
MSQKATIGLIALTPEIDCKKTEMGLPPITSAVFLIANKFLVKRGCLGGISDIPLLHIRRTCHNPPRGPCAGWWVLTTANATGTNSLTCLLKHGGVRDNKFLVTHPMTD